MLLKSRLIALSIIIVILTSSVNAISTNELRIVLKEVLKQYFENPQNSRLNVPELRDLLISFFETSTGQEVNLNKVGKHSGKILQEIYNRSKLTTTTKEWTIMVFMNGDNNLESAAIGDINEMEMVGSNDNVNVIVQLDRSPKFDNSNENWHSTKRFYVEKDSNPLITSKELADIGEANMASSSTLYEFLKWTTEQYPAKKNVLILWNHGGGWQSMSNDDTDQPRGMSLPELENALQKFKQDNGKKLSIIAFDMCLMGQIELDVAIAPYASIRIGSQELEPNEGFDYTNMLQKLALKPEIEPEEFAVNVVEGYKSFYEKAGKAGGVTLSAIRLDKISNVVDRFQDFSQKINSDLQFSWEATSRALGVVETYARDRSDFGSIDLSDFADSFKSQSVVSSELNTAAESVIEAVEESVIASTSGKAHPYSRGIAVYFPIDNQYFDAKYMTDSKFSQKTDWGNTISKFYRTKKSVISQGPEIKIQTQPTELKAGNSLVIDYTVAGKHLFDIRYLTAWVTEDKILVLEENFPRINTELGWAIPSLIDGQNNLSLEWKATAISLTNGKQEVFATMRPYGRVLGFFTLYYTEGVYRSPSTGEQYDVTLVFDYSDGTMVYAWAYVDNGQGVISPVEITPKPDDIFIPYRTFINLLEDSIENFPSEEEAMTFSGGLFVKEEPLFDGDFLVYIIAEDLTGKTAEGYVAVVVK